MPSITKKQQVLKYTRKHAVVRPKDLERLGLPQEYLYRLFKAGALERIGRGLYRYPTRAVSHHQSLIEATKQAPNAIVSLLSALSFHQFTTQNPFEVWLAIDRKAWRPHIEYPPVRFVTMSAALLAEGVETHNVDGVAVRVFNPARTVVDCFKYRNKIGLDVALEALREGWRERRFSMDEIARYARACRVGNVMRPYLESLT